MPKSVSFTLLNETPGAYRYQEVDAEGDPVLDSDAAYIGALYIRKALASEFLGGLVDGKAPERITVTVEVAAAQPASAEELFGADKQ